MMLMISESSADPTIDIMAIASKWNIAEVNTHHNLHSLMLLIRMNLLLHLH